ncbi:hypothetical protein SAMN05661044_05653 [Olivibacter domesticus]|uniref:Uncharacterized protein n=1 Tax=Olivibacter domesticus TaxID=407022 RepID=A0A1H7ZYJ5_OLID1|nr:hypothetical protein SAMN05661044_05653 [Olivibacter domesticus]
MKYNIFARHRGKVTLVNTQLTEQDATDQVNVLNLLNDEGEIYYKLPAKVVEIETTNNSVTKH